MVRAVDTVVCARGLALGGRPLDLEVFPGEVFAIVGAAGAGKTTLVEILAGIRAAPARELTILAGADRRRMGALLDRTAFDRHLTVAEGLSLMCRLRGLALPDTAFTMMGIAALRDRRIDRLAPSDARRVLVTAAAMHDPLLLLADDPARDLDLEASRRLWNVIHQRRARGRTTIFATDRVDEAERLADRVAVLSRGSLVAVDSPGRLVAASSAPARIAFNLPAPVIAPHSLEGVDAVVDVRVSRGLYTILSRDALASLRGLLRALEHARVTPASLSVRQATLEDAIVEMTLAEAS